MGQSDTFLRYATIYMVKDHRTNQEITDVGKVMDGYIDPFINAYLKWINIKKDN